MELQLIIGFILMILGAIIISCPDNNQRLFSISHEHGPSLLDFIGILILLFGYFFIIIRIWKYQKNLRKYFETKIFRILLFMSGLGTGLLIASVAGDFKQWWIIGCSILTLIQILAIYAIINNKGRN
ncbi:hypothetical protein E5161_17060 [Cohnella pontilimi]|uniref:Uncharacterized protein n=1 Tax=Cohnella pontilimi TaxID=2564100 RepID=A0A4U0F849_9BACL|nr:hypothetical protein [Cohnella pontilimi]TJY40847.1 hypothetical protein E5161_17060 [Cohnella pontilimi]